MNKRVIKILMPALLIISVLVFFSPLKAQTTGTELTEGFETGNLDSWNRCFSTATGYSAQIVNNIRNSGNNSLRMELRRDDPIIQGSKRSEVSLPEETPLEENWYVVHIYLPDGAEDYENDPDSPEIILQWHNYPDTNEQWTSPPLALLTRNNHYYIERLWDEGVYSTTSLMKNKGNYDLVDLGSYANDKGRWVEWAFHVKWGWLDSQNPFIKIYKDKKQVFSRVGPNTTNDSKGNYMKMGIYKWEWNNPANRSVVQKRVVYYDDIYIGDNYSINSGGVYDARLEDAKGMVNNGKCILRIEEAPVNHRYKYFKNADGGRVALLPVGMDLSGWTDIAENQMIQINSYQHLGLAEVDENNRLVEFNDITAVMIEERVQPGLVPELVNGLSFLLPVDLNNNYGNTQVVLGSPSVAGNTFRYKITENGNGVPPPRIGEDLSGWTAVPDSRLITVPNNMFIGVAEVNASSQAVQFSTSKAVSYEPGIYTEDDSGLIDITAVQYHYKVDKNNHSWIYASDTAATPTKYYMQALPDNGLFCDTGYINGSPSVNYKINFTTAGTYYVYIKLKGSGLSSDSLHIGLDGNEVYDGYKIPAPSQDSFKWQQQNGYAQRIKVDVGSTGQHTLNVYLREDGTKLERIVLTKNISYVPAN
ncbi:MAG: heparin lyase I family protein [Clostridia bacterium]|nr:heparin lyase I family protein [Clostridia bacterium]